MSDYNSYEEIPERVRMAQAWIGVFYVGQSPLHFTCAAYVVRGPVLTLYDVVIDWKIDEGVVIFTKRRNHHAMMMLSQHAPWIILPWTEGVTPPPAAPPATVPE